MPDEVLERVAGGAKDPEWKPTGNIAKTASKVWDYSVQFEIELSNFNPGYKIKTSVDKDLYLVQYHSGKPLGESRSLRYWTTTNEANSISTVEEYKSKMALLNRWGSRDHVTVAKIPAGTKVKYAIGTAREQLRDFELKEGGGLQLLFDYFDEGWIIENAKLP